MSGFLSAYGLIAVLVFAVFGMFLQTMAIKNPTRLDRVRLVGVAAIVAALWPVFGMYASSLWALRFWLRHGESW